MNSLKKVTHLSSLSPLDYWHHQKTKRLLIKRVVFLIFTSFPLPAHCPFNIPIINIYIIAVHSHLSSASSVKIQSLKLRTWWNGCSHEFGEGFDGQKAKKVSHESELRTSTLTDLVTALGKRQSTSSETQKKYHKVKK